MTQDTFDGRRRARHALVMKTAGPAHDALAAQLPPGYRVRDFDDADRETLVEDRNAEHDLMQRGSADEWREWERLVPPKDELRITVVAPDGAVAGTATIGPGMFERPDGTLSGGVGIVRAHRRRGIGRVLLGAIEAEAHRRNAPRILGSASAAIAAGLAFATSAGYREIGRRIESYVKLDEFDATPFAAEVKRVTESGIAFTTIADVLASRDEAGQEAFWRELYEAEGPMWDDIPWASPMPHWSFERFRKLAVRSGKLIEGASLLAYDGPAIVAFTTTGRQGDKGHTWMTGTARAYRGRGIALALKVAMLERAAAAGLGAMLTTNDEPNKAMRGINAKLGYVMLPAQIELEKQL